MLGQSGARRDGNRDLRRDGRAETRRYSTFTNRPARFRLIQGPPAAPALVLLRQHRARTTPKRHGNRDGRARDDADDSEQLSHLLIVGDRPDTCPACGSRCQLQPGTREADAVNRKPDVGAKFAVSRDDLLQRAGQDPSPGQARVPRLAHRRPGHDVVGRGTMLRGQAEAGIG